MTDKYQKLPTFHFSDEIRKRHTKKNLKCVIFGNFGAKNLGDEALLAGQIQELQKIPNMHITVVGKSPTDIKRIHKVNAFSMYDLNKVRKEIKKADFVMVGGGGLINKMERSIIGLAFQIYITFVFFFLPRMYKKKTYITGIGIYNNANPIIVSLVLPFFRNAGFVTVRDHHSQEFLRKKNVLSTLYKDNSFLMDLAPLTQVHQDSFFKGNYRKERMNIGLSLVRPEKKKHEKRYIKELITFIQNHKDKADFWFYATDYNSAYFNDEKFSKIFMEEVKKKLGNDVVMHLVPGDLKPQIYFASFKLMSFIIATRFHAAVFAYRSKIPFAGISYDKKCSSFIEAVGVKPIHMEHVKAEEIQKYAPPI